VDASGNVLIADTNNHRVRKVDAATGIISTVVGAGRSTCQGAGPGPFPPDMSCLEYPGGVAVAKNGDIFILDSQDNRVVKLDHVSGNVFVVAGGTSTSPYGTGSYCGDGGPAIAACLNTSARFGAETPPPAGLAVDPSGNVFISDVGNNRIRRVDARTQIITTVAGNGQNGFSGDGGPATSAALTPAGIAVDPRGDLFFTDGNARIRRVDAVTGTITTFAGNGLADSTGDGGPAASARVAGTIGVAWAADGSNSLFITEADGSNRIRVITPVQ
jgi:streptogramin lyase